MTDEEINISLSDDLMNDNLLVPQIPAMTNDFITTTIQEFS